MNDFSIGIIGGTGGIGKLFAGFFADWGYAVLVKGRKKGPPLREIAGQCQVVIVAVPIAATLEVINQMGPIMPKDALLMDFTSLKGEFVKAMLAATEAEVVGCHPLFGPDVSSSRGQNIILCPARGERWLGIFRDLFAGKGAVVTIADPDEHDRMMAVIQGLNHFNTIMMELAVRDSKIKPSRLEKFSTPMFRTKQKTGKRLFGESAGLYASILTGNPYLPELIAMYEKNLSLLKGLIQRGDTSGLSELLKGKK
jgi:prephenate dehydrogenase